MPVILADFNKIRFDSTDFRKILKYQISLSRPVEAIFHADRHTDEHRYTNRRDEANVRFQAVLRKRSRNRVGADNN